MDTAQDATFAILPGAPQDPDCASEEEIGQGQPLQPAIRGKTRRIVTIAVQMRRALLAYRRIGAEIGTRHLIMCLGRADRRDPVEQPRQRRGRCASRWKPMAQAQRSSGRLVKSAVAMRHRAVPASVRGARKMARSACPAGLSRAGGGSMASPARHPSPAPDRACRPGPYRRRACPCYRSAAARTG